MLTLFEWDSIVKPIFLLCEMLSVFQISMCNNSINTSNIINGTCKVDLGWGLGYSLLFLLGFLVNAAALRAFIAKRDSWTDTHVYMLNLNIADFALILFLPFRVYDAFFCLPKTYLCTFLIHIHFVNMYVSVLTTAAISIHRYLAIRFPLQTRSWRKKKEAFAVCLVLWVLVATISALFLKENHPNKLWTCYERCEDAPLQLWVIVILTFLGVLAPLLIVLFCSSQIISILLKVHDMSGESKQTIGIVTANMTVFIVCYTPIHIAFLIDYFVIPPPDWKSAYLPKHTYFLVSEWIASTNCCFDSVSYYFLLMNSIRKSQVEL